MRISDWSSDGCSSDLSRSRISSQSGARAAQAAFGVETSAPAGAAAAAVMAVSAAVGRPSGTRRGPERQGHDRPEPVGSAAVEVDGRCGEADRADRSEEHTSELQSLMRTSYAVFCLKKTKNHTTDHESH